MNFNKGRARSRRNSMSVVNSEKWRNYGKRASRKETELMKDDSDDDELKYNEMKDWVQNFFAKKSSCEDRTDQDVEVQLTPRQTLILSTLVPDEILLIEQFGDLEPKRFVGVLLMADVSGYTSLSERYNNTGKGGTYRLTVTLNTYLGSLIELIYTHGGDILKFAGDAFLALWKTDKRTFLCHTIHNVIACALLIQHSYSTYETDVKVSLRVKLAISAGNLMFAPIGTGIDMNYVIIGLPVLEAKAAESVCSSGEVKLTKTAWAHCYSRNYDHVIHEDGHVTIKSILYDPHDSDVNKPFLGFSAMVKQIKRPLNAGEPLPDFLLEPNKCLSTAEVIKKNEILNLRKTIFMAGENNTGSEIRKFMIRPVLTQIDAHQPLEYLTEMRQVSILFITLKPRECPFLQLITIVNNAYQITCDIVYKSMGCVNKIILFDKDIMILVVFGLRGFKHESEAQAALKCAYSIRKSVAALDGVMEVSVGVTTGQVYCGVVGHPLRREFTVIGAIVNKAARLMCGFRNRVTCDEVTFVKSKMSPNSFNLQPKTELKGIGQPGKIYEYTEDIRVKELYDIPMIPPLLDRHDEMEYYESWLNDSHEAFRDFDALLLVGESRIGKTRLIEWMARYARNFGRVSVVTLSSIHSATPYLALNQIMNQILGINEPAVGFAKEEKIVQLMKVYTEDLCYLNNILKVKFAFHERIYSYDENKRKEKAKLVFGKLIKAIMETQVVLLDDLQNLDAFSWEFITLMFDSMKIFTVSSVTRGKFSSVQNWLYGVFINSSVRKMVLGPLATSWIPALACQILDVNAVPKDLCDALLSKCGGMPGLVESFIIHLFSNGALELKKIQETETEDWTEAHLQFPDSKLLHPQALDVKDQLTLDEFIEKDNTGEIGICIVTRTEELKTNIDVQNLDALVMIQIDSLTPYQQLLLKIASVIGNVVSRDLLESIMYENNPLVTAKAIKRLFAMRILSCATSHQAKYNRKFVAGAPLLQNVNINLTCDCSFEYDPEISENLPKYAFCKVIKFKNKNTRNTCYELLPMNQKKEFHARVVNYLENNKIKCPSCGGGVMIVQSLNSLAPNDSFSSTCDSIHLENTSSSDTEDDDEMDNPSCISEKVGKEQLETLGNLNNDNKEIFQSNSEEIITKHVSTESTNLNKIKTQYNSILKTKISDVENVLSPSRRSTKRVTMTNFSFKNTSIEFESYKVFDMLREVTEAEHLSDWHSLGVKDSKDDLITEKQEKNNNRQPMSVKIEKGVSQTNFSKCTCAELRIAIYEQLINHASLAELKSKAIEFLLTSSYLNILANNVDTVIPKLEEAEKMCSGAHGNLEPLVKKRFIAKIHSLRAAACLMSGRLAAAKTSLERALKAYRINLDKVKSVFQITHIIDSIKMKRKKYRSYEMTMRSDSVFCLNIATLLNSMLGEERLSRLAAIRALQIVRDVECPVVDICDAYSNAIVVELDRGTPDATVEIEKIASQTLRQLARPIRAEELYSIGKLYMESFRARLSRAQLAPAIRSGFRALTVSRFLQANNVSLDIVPDLFYVLLSRRRIEEAVDIVQLALRMGANQVSQDSETWYYALCMDMILDAGFQLESPMEISRFAEFALCRGKSAGPSRRRLVVGLWTYWLRADSEKKAKRFESEALSWTSSDDDEGSLTNLLSAMRLADGMLESLAKKVNDLKKVVDIMELRSIADRELTRLEKDARLMRALYPRWILLRANTLKLSSRKSAAKALFDQALEESRRINNYLEEALARAAITKSVFWTQSARSSNFLNWQAGAEHARSSWYQIMYRISTTRQ